MPSPYSLDLRERILKFHEDGVPIDDLVEQFAVSRSTVYSFIKKQRETGNIAPKKRQCGINLKLTPHEQLIRQLVADQPDATLVELHAQLPNKDNVTVVTLHNFLKRLKITWKKNSLCCRTTSPRCCRRARGVERTPGSFRHRKTHFHRRNLDENEHDTAVWSCRDRQAGD